MPTSTTIDTLTPHEAEVLSTYAGRIELALASGHRTLAHKLVDQADKAMSSANKFEQTLLETSLADTGLSVRMLNSLERHLKVLTIGQALELRLEQFAEVPMYGPAMTVDLYQSLLRYIVPRYQRLEEELQRRE
jgi:hypothetical protein